MPSHRRSINFPAISVADRFDESMGKNIYICIYIYMYTQATDSHRPSYNEEFLVDRREFGRQNKKKKNVKMEEGPRFCFVDTR